MSVLWLWLRRGLASWSVLALAGFLLLSALTGEHSVRDPNWGGRSLATAMFFYSPVLAATVAHDIGLRVEPSLGFVARSSVRGWASGLVSAVAATSAAMVLSVVSWVALAAASALNDGIGFSDLLIAPETAAALAAAASVGVVIGVAKPGLLGAPAAAGVVLLAQILTRQWELTVFQVASSAGTMVGIERTPARAGLAIAVNLAVSFSCLLTAWVMSSHVLRRRTVWWGIGAVPLVLVLLFRPVLLPSDSEYRPSASAVSCVGTEPTVCGPASASSLLRDAQRSLAAAVVRLRPSGLPFPGRFSVARGEAVRDLPLGTAQLELDPSRFGPGGVLAVEDVVAALAVPRFCVELTDARTAEPLLEEIVLVRDYVSGRLSTDVTDAPAPAPVRAAYEDLLTCGR